MADMMSFPDSWEEFEKIYGFNDREEVYTNNARLIPSFRVEQWLDHIERMGRWVKDEHGLTRCSECGRRPLRSRYYNIFGDLCAKEKLSEYCPRCGARMMQGGCFGYSVVARSGAPAVRWLRIALTVTEA